MEILEPVTVAVSNQIENEENEEKRTDGGVVLVLGWSNKLAPLLRQLAVANQSLGGGVIGVLANRDVQQMEQDIKSHDIDFLGTTVNFYPGSRLNSEALQKAPVSEARSIIILAESKDAEQSDAHAVKIIRTILGVIDQAEFKGQIVVELIDVENEPWVKQAGGELVETVVAQDVIGRLMIQCARQPGLAQVWEDILGFDNAEFYIKRWPELDGMRFGDVVISFPEAIPCGIKAAGIEGKIVLNPGDDYELAEGDELLVVAEDDDTYAPSTSLPEIRNVSAPKVVSNVKPVKKILFCGWRRDMDDMIIVLEKALGPGSELWVFSEVPEEERGKRLLDKGMNSAHFKNVKLVHRTGSANKKKHLETLPLETFDSILLVADADSVFEADLYPLTTLLLIRGIQSKRMPYREAKAVQIRQGGSTQSTWVHEMQHGTNQSIIVNEILDAETKAVIAEADASEIVISDEMVSMVLAMVAEDKKINSVLEELFAEEGNEILIRPAEMYLDDEEEMELSFYEIMLLGRHRKEIVLGYQSALDDRAVINPPNKATLRSWSLDDSFIVLAKSD